MSSLNDFVTACNYPGALDEERVEIELRRYMAEVGIKCKIARLHRGWTLAQHPSFKKYEEHAPVILPGTRKFRSGIKQEYDHLAEEARQVQD